MTGGNLAAPTGEKEKGWTSECVASMVANQMMWPTMAVLVIHKVIVQKRTMRQVVDRPSVEEADSVSTRFLKGQQQIVQLVVDQLFHKIVSQHSPSSSACTPHGFH